MKPAGTARAAAGRAQARLLHRALLALTCNAAFTLYHGVLGILQVSLWLLAMCAFYAILSAMRFCAVLCAHGGGARNEEAARFVMKVCGGLLILLSAVLGGVNFLSLRENIATKYGEITMITIAAYTFYKITLAAIRGARRRGGAGTLPTVLRRIGYAEVAASVLTLQRSMLVSFGAMAEKDIHLMNAMTGGGVCLFILLLGISMVAQTGKKGRYNMAKSKLVKTNEVIAEKVTGAFGKLEDGVVNSYKKIETGVVHGYTKIEDAFVDRYLTRDGESVEDAKRRLRGKHGAE